MSSTEPVVEPVSLPDGQIVARVRGYWTLSALGPRYRALCEQLREVRQVATRWDLADLSALDSAGAVMLWQAWGRQLPKDLRVSDERRSVLERLQHLAPPIPGGHRVMPLAWLARLGSSVLCWGDQLLGLVELTGRLVLDFGYTLRDPARAPLREFSATLYKAGALAMPICALLGFLIGVVLSYLSALQLRSFGAEVFIVNMLGLGVVRELGPVLVAVLVAGRSGSAMTAQLGTMRVTEELDALAAMGVSVTQRLVLPKVLALAVATPLLVLWTTAAALAGGMVAAQFQLDLSYAFFLESLPRVVRVSNLYIGLGKGIAFGFSIALLACHYGLRVKPNTESLSSNTTTSVVVGISVVILIDALFALVMRTVGMPG